MTPRPERIVDAHVHLWDPARTDWYPYLTGGRDLGLGDTSAMARRFDLPTYRAESAGWNVVKLVHVAAATGAHSVAETLELDRRGEVAAIVGGVVTSGTTAEAVAMLDEQLAARRFRGVRPMGPSADPVPPDAVLRALADRDLLLELMAHPDQLHDAARRLDGVEDLLVVVEHTGWPRSASPAEHELWRSGLRAVASLGDRVACKLSGLAMPLGTMEPAVLAPWIEHAVDVFGVDRCLFASNFPVDGLHGTLDQLLSAYSAVTGGLGADAREQLFAANAERIYRC